MTSFVMTMDPTLNQQAGSNHRFSEELQWIAQAREDLNAFSPLYEKYYEQVYIFVYRRCTDAEDCLDIISRVFEKAMLNIGKYQYRGYAFSTWLFRIAQNELADYFKKKNREQKLWVRDEGVLDMIAEMQYDDGSEEKIVAILSVLEGLETKERELVVMRYFEKREYEELAEIEDTTVNYLRVKMHRILTKIKTNLERRNLK